MSENQISETIPVPRHRIFVMADAKFVVQWEANRVQDLLSGRYYPYASEQTVSPISDFELNQLQLVGVVQVYDEEIVHLSSQPVMGRVPSRSYYLNTTLPKTMKDDVESALLEKDLANHYAVRVQQTFVIIRGPGGIPFSEYDMAEKAREQLVNVLPEFFRDAIVAFVEIVDVP